MCYEASTSEHGEELQEQTALSLTCVNYQY